jgi:hypothetical protein
MRDDGLAVFCDFLNFLELLLKMCFVILEFPVDHHLGIGLA